LAVCKLTEVTATRSGNLRGENINEEVHRQLSLIDPKTVIKKELVPIERDFLEIAEEVGTDKVTTHKYNFA
jgi:hypothetical protein